MFKKAVTGDDVVARLRTFPAVFLELEWPPDLHLSNRVAVGAVLRIIAR